MTALDLSSIARLLGGEVVGGKVRAPGPRHSRADRSMVVWPSPDGFTVHSFAGDDWRDCRGYVREQQCLPPETGPHRLTEAHRRARAPRPEDDGDRNRALALWRRRKPAVGSLAERYLRQARGYQGPIPATLGFLPARGEYAPAMIAPYATASEPEPGVLAIDDEDIRAVHLTRLRAGRL